MTDLATLRARADDTAGLLLYARACLRAGEPCPEIMACLRSVEAWDAAIPEVQDAAAAEVARRMGEGWRFERMSVEEWRIEPEHRLTCALEGRRIVGTASGLMTSRRIAVYIHEATGAEFSLCPGAVRTCPYPGMKQPCMRGHVRHEHVEAAPLLVARTPVTERQWSGSEHAPCVPAVGARHTTVLGWLVGSGIRLPTTTEWRHFAAAGTTTRFWWGDEMDDRYCWHEGNSAHCYDYPGSCTHYPLCDILLHPVTEHDKPGLRSPLGLVDVFGNAAEWTADGGVHGGCYADPPGTIGERIGWPRRGSSPPNVGFRPVADIGE